MSERERGLPKRSGSAAANLATGGPSACVRAQSELIISEKQNGRRACKASRLSA